VSQAGSSGQAGRQQCAGSNSGRQCAGSSVRAEAGGSNRQQRCAGSTRQPRCGCATVRPADAARGGAGGARFPSRNTTVLGPCQPDSPPVWGEKLPLLRSSAFRRRGRAAVRRESRLGPQRGPSDTPSPGSRGGCLSAGRGSSAVGPAVPRAGCHAQRCPGLQLPVALQLAARGAGVFPQSPNACRRQSAAEVAGRRRGARRGCPAVPVSRRCAGLAPRCLVSSLAAGALRFAFPKPVAVPAWAGAGKPLGHQKHPSSLGDECPLCCPCQGWGLMSSPGVGSRRRVCFAAALPQTLGPGLFS